MKAEPARYRRGLAASLAVAIVVAGCSRGPAPPAPIEDLTPTTIGVVETGAIGMPVTLTNGSTFAPPAGAAVERIKNWPARATSEAEGPTPGILLLGGQRADGTWWYELAGFLGGPDESGCWSIGGGSFDEGSSVRLSSGLRLPKAPGFFINAQGNTDDVQWFPGHQDDSICVDEQGRAVRFDAFIGR